VKQPDFVQIFRDYFGRVPRKVVYSVRRDNRQHDLLFLRSLIHDADFKLSDVSRRGKRLTFALVRDCWELGLVERPGACELYMAASRLTIWPVHQVEWRLPHGWPLTDSSLMIDDFWLERSLSEMACLVIDGHRWSCRISVLQDDLRIRLADLETPYLWSSKERGGAL
jgi:hypothetical protein